MPVIVCSVFVHTVRSPEAVEMLLSGHTCGHTSFTHHLLLRPPCMTLKRETGISEQSSVLHIQKFRSLWTRSLIWHWSRNRFHSHFPWKRKAWFPYDRCDRSQTCSSIAVISIADWFPYDRRDRYETWKALYKENSDSREIASGTKKTVHPVHCEVTTLFINFFSTWKPV